MRFAWDKAKSLANLQKHDVSFEEASELFDSGSDYLEIFDDEHSSGEDRFIAIGPIRRGLVLIVWTERDDATIRIISVPGQRNRNRSCIAHTRKRNMVEIPELTASQLARAIPARTRKRLMLGQIESGDDITALRRFVGLTQMQFAQAMGISVHTLRNWEQGRRHPDGPAIALLRIATRHPRIIRENLESAA